MTAETIGIWVSLAGLFLAVGSLLVKLGRVLERQKVHDEELVRQRDELDELATGHADQRADFEGMRSDMRSVRSAIDSMALSVRELVSRMDRHMDQG